MFFQAIMSDPNWRGGVQTSMWKTATVSQTISSRVEGSERENRGKILMLRYRGCTKSTCSCWSWRVKKRWRFEIAKDYYDGQLPANGLRLARQSRSWTCFWDFCDSMHVASWLVLKVAVPACCVYWRGNVEVHVLCFSGLEPSRIVQVLSQNLKIQTKKRTLWN